GHVVLHVVEDALALGGKLRHVHSRRWRAVAEHPLEHGSGVILGGDWLVLAGRDHATERVDPVVADADHAELERGEPARGPHFLGDVLIDRDPAGEAHGELITAWLLVPDGGAAPGGRSEHV